MIRMTLLVGVLALAGCKKDEAKKDTAPAKTETTPEVKGENEAPKENSQNEAADAALMARGEYLMGLMGCEQCHTPFKGPAPDASKRYAGGLEVPEVFGTWRSPNITQDAETGIGSWTDEQIIDAIRLGKRADGEQLYPIMPYLFYNTMSDGDAKAIVAYLRTVPAIANTVERAELKLPKIPAPPAKGEEPDTGNPVAHGAYLASIMHCAACHTPMSPEGPDMSRAFAGGMELELPPLGEGKIYTANLTSDPKTGIGEWSDEEIVAAVRQMKKRGGGMILPPMALYQGGWAMMTDDDVNHLVAFLRSLPAIENAVPASTFKPHAAPPAGAPAAE